MIIDKKVIIKNSDYNNNRLIKNLLKAKKFSEFEKFI